MEMPFPEAVNLLVSISRALDALKPLSLNFSETICKSKNQSSEEEFTYNLLQLLKFQLWTV